MVENRPGRGVGVRDPAKLARDTMTGRISQWPDPFVPDNVLDDRTVIADAKDHMVRLIP